MIVPQSTSPPAVPRPRLEDRRLVVTFERRLVWLVLAGGFPGVAVSLWALEQLTLPPEVYWTLVSVVVSSWLGATFLLRERLTQSLRTISNILMAFREGDYTLRAARAHRDDALGEILIELNLFADTLRSGRLDSAEATFLLDQVIAAVDVAIFAFDDASCLRMLNPAGARLVARDSREALGVTAEALGLGAALAAGDGATLEIGGGAGRYLVRRGAFRAEGRAHVFLMLSDASTALRQEEREAWRRLVRVLSHEINNSLSPIKSMAGALRHIVQREPLPHDWRDDLESALEVIEGRAEALRRFTTGYATLARLPEPRLMPVDIAALVQRAVELEARLAVRVEGGTVTPLLADADQLEQVLINLLRNAADAVQAEGGAVVIRWRMDQAGLTLDVLDTGPGILNVDNVFVPFFTTKPGGSGIGLALCRQIVEAHGGTLTLENRDDGPGCRARLRLPRAGQPTAGLVLG